MNSITHIRHATVLVELDGLTVLVDPLLGEQDAYDPVEGTTNPRTWPLVGLPIPAEEVVARADAVVFTHTHVDHIDDVAVTLIAAAGIPVFCQPEDQTELCERGAGDVRPVEAEARLGHVTLVRTGGQHGTGETANLMGPVSGYVLSVGEDSVYVAGDTVWCEEVHTALGGHQPRVTVVNSGEARMEYGDPITMSAADVIQVATAMPETVVVAVHLEALNHCGLGRGELLAATERAGVTVHVPADGQRLEFSAIAR